MVRMVAGSISGRGLHTGSDQRKRWSVVVFGIVGPTTSPLGCAATLNGVSLLAEAR
jgi:hypothetical protein